MTEKPTLRIRLAADADREWISEIFRGWGAEFIVSRGRITYPDQVEGLIAEDSSGRKLGLLTFKVTGDQCEVVTLDALDKFRGTGTALIEELLHIMRARRVRRVWLITTNDNLDAIRFYQRRGWTIAAVHVNALERSRELKPAISLIGRYGIPLRDEIEFEILL